jgi:hypothetical protein
MPREWREAAALEKLLIQVNQKYPNRSKLSDGELGDTAHAARVSDHNPNADGVVTALDITNDPAHGLISRQLAEALVASKDKRIKYIISNRQIAAGRLGPDPWHWRKYSGLNPHEHHMHISVLGDKADYDDTTEWNLVWPTTEPVKVAEPAVGSTKWLQMELNKHGFQLQVDGHEGELTQAAIRAYAVDKLKGN